MSSTTHDRYHRQLILQGFGSGAQDALTKAKVLVIGAGGLGCPVLQYLVAAGVGTIGIVENDQVSLSNLHRQVLYDTTDVGRQKIEVAAEKLRLINPEVIIVCYPIYLDKINSLTIIAEYDVIVDCTDNFATRYMVNDACVIIGRPLVYGAVSEFEGQVAVFNVGSEEGRRSANYRDLFPEQPKSGEVLNCAEAGVLGVLPGIIGSLQATEVIKLITGKGDVLINQLLTYNALKNRMNVFNYSVNENATLMSPTTAEAFQQMEYNDNCIVETTSYGIDVFQLEQLMKEKNAVIVDVREPHELPFITQYHHHKIPLPQLQTRLPEIAEQTIIFICQSGTRSLQAAQMAAAYFANEHRFYSLNGGVIQLISLPESKSL